MFKSEEVKVKILVELQIFGTPLHFHGGCLKNNQITTNFI